MARYSLEELMELSGYSAAMIYDLTFQRVLSPPVRGIEPEQYGSKGSYPPECATQLAEYKRLKLLGLKKKIILARMRL